MLATVGWRQRFFAVGVCAFLTLASAPAVAVGVDGWPETAVMMAQPDDPNAVFVFADRALAEGRPDAAAAALERLLRFRPDNSDARERLEEAYAAMTRSSPRAPTISDVFIALGGGYDDNPGAVPFGPTIRLADADGVVRDETLNISRAGSAVAFVQAEATVETRLGPEATPVFFDLSGYAEHIAALDDLDDVSVSGKATAELETVSPFASVAFSAFGGEAYDLAVRAGAGRTFDAGDGDVFLEVSGGWNEYFSSSLAPTLDRLDGFDARLSAFYSQG